MTLISCRTTDLFAHNYILGIRISPDQTRKSKKPILRQESLLGTSRAARLKEDSNVFLLQDNFRIQCLVNKSEMLYN